MAVDNNEDDNERVKVISQSHCDQVIKKSKINSRSNSQDNENTDRALEATKLVFKENNQ